MEKPPFQFSLRSLLLAVAASSLWIGAAEIIDSPDNGPFILRLVVFAVIANAIYILVRRYRLGWAIAVFATPIVVLVALSLASLFAG